MPCILQNFSCRASFIGSKILTPVQRAIVHKEVDSNSKVKLTMENNLLIKQRLAGFNFGYLFTQADSHDLSPCKIPRPVKAFFQIEKLGLNSLKVSFNNMHVFNVIREKSFLSILLKT